MNRKLLFTWLFLAIGLILQAQNGGDPIHFSVSQKKVAPDRVEIIFQGKMDNGWHVYSTALPANGPTSATFNLEAADGAVIDGKLMPRGKEISRYDNLFEMNVRYFEHEATFVQNIKITAPKYSVKGYLEYGACNDQNCLPPTSVEFNFKGEGKPAADETVLAPVSRDTVATVNMDTTTQVSAMADSTAIGKNALWTPVIDQLKTYGEESINSGMGWMKIFLLGMLGGLVALFTPCVWPIIPMTVSFFLKRSKNKRKGIRDAVIYGISIIVIYVALGLFITLVFGASALNAMATNAVFNIFFFLLLLVFAASFFGWFELTLPSSWSSSVDSKAEKTSGLLSIFLMAFTLSLVSFSCTGPIIGFLLVEVSTTGSVIAPLIGMFGFAFALALPFTLFALFPTWLKQMPKSGNWMNNIKVILGFIELAFSLKFLSVADLAYGWHILDREVFLVLWIIMFFLLGAYLLGWFRFPHDENEYDENGNVIINPRTSVPKFFLAMISMAFALYMVPGLWGAPLKAVSAFAPPISTQDFNLYKNEVKAEFTDYDLGMAYAKQQKKPVLIDFSGYGCVNCRKMEGSVWSDTHVADIMQKDYVLIQLFVDDKTPLPQKIQVRENGQTRTLRTVGDRWSYLQRSKFGAVAQPFYVLLDNEGMPLNKSYSFDENKDNFIRFLNTGLDNYKRR